MFRADHLNISGEGAIVKTALLPDLGTLVGIMAHPDDLFYAAAGIMYAARQEGHPVTSVSATSGEGGSLDHERWPPERIGAVREQEEIKAYAHIDVEDVRFLGFPDGYLHEVPFETGVAAVLNILLEIKPQTVVTYGPDGLTGHNDHQIISAWATEAFRRAQLPGARLLYVAATPEWVEEIVPVLAQADAIYESPPAVPVTELFIDYRLPDDVLALKWVGVLAHESQSLPLGASIGALSILMPWFARETFRLATV